MSDKAKRKSNPRRRTLIRLLMAIAIIGALISAGYYALRPTGAQIVFIAPDDNGVDNIWIADLNNPEHPRQLTFSDEAITGFDIAIHSKGLVYMSSSSPEKRYDEIRLLDVQTGQNRIVTTCEGMCSRYQLHSSGNWLVYMDNIFDNGVSSATVHVLNLESSESREIYEYQHPGQNFRVEFLLQWVRATELLIMWTGTNWDTDEEIYFHSIYDLDTDELNEVEPIDFDTVVLFSDDGSRYVDYNYQNEIEATMQVRIPYDTTLMLGIDMGFDENESDPILTFYQDWHPDNETILISQGWLSDENAINVELRLYNTSTGDYETLVVNEESYWEAAFDAEGTKIVYSIGFGKTNGQLAVYDMETGEETLLPLFGYRPQWVNGGR